MWRKILTRKIPGSSLCRLHLLLLLLCFPRHLLLLICFPPHRSLRFHLRFPFNLKIMCWVAGGGGTYLLGKFTKPAIILPFGNDGLRNPEAVASGRPPTLRAKQNLPTLGTLSGPKAESTWTCSGPSAQSHASGLKPKPSSHRPRGAFPISSFIPTLPSCFLPQASKQASFFSEGK